MKPPAPPLLHLEKLSFAYRALPVLVAIDWGWQVGQQWACVGPNGAGKTTLAMLLSGQLVHASGTIARSEALRERGTAYVCFEQQRALCHRDQQLDDSEFRSDARDPGTTVATMLGIGDEIHGETAAWIDRLQIRHILDRGIRFISTGEMRKTLLLSAILRRPRLLILDSPLDGLDRDAQREMAAILQELIDDGFNLLLLCRSLEDLPPGISHLLVLDRGTLLSAGERAPVLADPAVTALMCPPPPELGKLPPTADRPYRVDPSRPLLELRDVSVRYGDTEVLNTVDWTFRRGQHCHIAGPNGCGKTTLLSLVNGDNHKAYGQDITLFGQRRGSGESVWDIKQKFGLLNTELHLNHVRGMRVLEVVVSGFFDSIGLYDDWGDAQKERAAAWLAALGIAGLARQGFDSLSFGMQRMVLLARAVVKSPLILVLDEPCLGLDGHHTEIILRAVDHIAAETDTQVLFVSHSAGQAPDCINQWLEFVPGERGFELRCRES